MRGKLKIVFGVLATAVIIFVFGGVLVGKAAPRGDMYEYLTNFREVLHLVTSNYVEDVEMGTLMKGAFRGMMESLDPSCVYLNPEEYALYLKGVSPKPASPGMTVSKRFMYAVVVACVPGGPAARAGLHSGDLIRVINGIHVREMSLRDVNDTLRGDEDTMVTLSVVDHRNGERREVELTREKEEPRPFNTIPLSGGPLYIKLHQADPVTSRDLSDYLRTEVNRSGSDDRGLILDLRNVADGDLAEAVKISDLFLDTGTIVAVRTRQGEEELHQAGSEQTIYAGPVALLVDRGTANAAEIIAAALGENDRATLIGEQTFGQGSVQQAIPLENGGALLLSVALYYSPSGTAFQLEGIEPDFEVETELDGAEISFEFLEAPEDTIHQALKDDPFISRAIQFLDSESERIDPNDSATDEAA